MWPQTLLKKLPQLDGLTGPMAESWIRRNTSSVNPFSGSILWMATKPCLQCLGLLLKWDKKFEENLRERMLVQLKFLSLEAFLMVSVTKDD